MTTQNGNPRRSWIEEYSAPEPKPYGPEHTLALKILQPLLESPQFKREKAIRESIRSGVTAASALYDAVLDAKTTEEAWKYVETHPLSSGGILGLILVANERPISQRSQKGPKVKAQKNAQRDLAAKKYVRAEFLRAKSRGEKMSLSDFWGLMVPVIRRDYPEATAKRSTMERNWLKGL